MDPTAHRSRRRVGGAAVLVLAPLLLGACNSFQSKEGTKIDATVSYWRPDPHGDVKISAGSQPGTASAASLSNDLSLSSDDQWLGRLNVCLGQHRFGFEYLPIQMSDSGPVDIPFTFQGATYPNADFITTDLDLKTYAVRWDYLLKSEKKKADALRVGLGAWYWSFDAHIKGVNSGNDERRDFSHVYPGAQGSWVSEYSKDVIVTLDGAYALNSLDNKVWDVSFDLGYKISAAGRVSVGYRYITWNFDEGGDEGNFNLQGPYAALTYGF